MNIQVLKRRFFVKMSGIVLITLLAIGCSRDMTDDPIPYVPFEDIVINLALPDYFSLHSNNSFKVLSQGGVKGIILYRENASTFHAFERNCSYNPQDVCSTVDIHVSQLYMYDNCCGSSFDFTGNPTGGPAWRPLRKYVTIVSGSEVIITDEVADR